MKRILILLFCIKISYSQTNWPLTKANASVQVGIPTEFGTPTVQALYTDGWEDGIFISRDGLNLYCIYLPADGLSWSLAGGPCVFAPYQKGPTFGMDLTTSPVTVCPTWLHGDVLISTRSSTLQAFNTWSLSNLSGPIFSEGAPQFSMLNATTSDIVVYTSNKLPPYKTDIYMIKNSGINPAESTGSVLPAPVTQTTTEDNPHLERLSANDLVLFFDSPDIPGGTGGLDLWFSTSNDDGVTWTVPQQTSLNTAENEHQPHLFKDASNQWWMYYTAPDASLKYAIYRAPQITPNDWINWGTKQLVVGPGNSAGIGEPTLTQNGDLSFVVINQDPNGTLTDKFDADPWILPRLNVNTDIKKPSLPIAKLFPNPSSEEITIIMNEEGDYSLKVSDQIGRTCYQTHFSKRITLYKQLIGNGIFFLNIYNKRHVIRTEKIIFTN